MIEDNIKDINILVALAHEGIIKEQAFEHLNNYELVNLLIHNG